MPTCSNCGAYCRDDAVFCSNCGAHFGSPKPTAEQSEKAFNDYFSRLNDADRTEEVEVNQGTAKKLDAQAARAQAAAAAAQAAQAQQSRAQASGPYANAQPYTPSEPRTTYTGRPVGPNVIDTTTAKVPYRELLSRAWADLKAMPNWLAKVLLLALVSCVPILNFFAEGFVLRWGARAAFGDGRNDMKMFQEGAFVLGFFAWVVNLIWGLAIGIVSAIPLIGLVGAVAAVLFAPFIQLCLMQIALSRQFGEAFQFGRIWPAYKAHFGGLMAMFWLPNLVVVAAAIIIGLVVSFGTVFMAAAAYSDAVLFMSMMFLFLILFVLIYAVAALAIGINLVVARAFGYWIADAQPEWVDAARSIGGDVVD